MSLWKSFLGGVAEFRHWLSEFLFPTVPDEPGEKRGSRWARLGFRITLIVGILSILVYAAQWSREDFLRIASLALLVALAGVLVGALIGFLFGIPRTLTQGSKTPEASGDAPAAGKENGDETGGSETEFRGNTNLEEISDWLTKIMVGLTLVQFEDIKRFVRNLVAFLVEGFGTEASHPAFVLSLLTFFPITGFFLGYLLTRLYLPLALKESESALRQKPLRKIDSEVQAVLQAGGSSALRMAAAAADPAVKDAIREQIRLLAEEYGRLRKTMPPGRERTRALELVATQMRALAKAGSAWLQGCVSSSVAGERLAAVVFLQVYPAQEHLDWLADRVGAEQPFIGYHAAVALLYAARKFGSSTLPAIRKAKSYLTKERAGSDESNVLAEAEREAVSAA